MFGGPSSAQFDALSNVVAAQSEMIKALSGQIDALTNLARPTSHTAASAAAEALLLKALIAAVVAEIAARAPDPYRELSDILGRVRFTAKEFLVGEPRSDYAIKEASKMICEHAEVYLRRGDRS